MTMGRGRPLTLSGGDRVTLRRPSFALFFLGTGITCVLLLNSPWELTKEMVAPWYLLLLSGLALLLLLRKEIRSLSGFLLESVIVSVVVTFLFRTLVWALGLSLQVFDWGIAVEVVAVSAAAYARERRDSRELSFTRPDMLAALVSVASFVVISLVAFRTPYTPAPDELRYTLGARSMNLFSAFPYTAPYKTLLVDFLDSSPLWIVTLSSYFSITSAPALSARVVGVFFLSVMSMATFSLASLLDSERVGLVALVLTLSTPALLLWSATALLGVAFATFTFLGFLFFVKSVRSESGVTTGFDPWTLVLATTCFALAYLTQTGELIVFAVSYAGLCYFAWRSTLARRRVLLTTLVGLPAAYLSIDFAYNLFTYADPVQWIHNLLLPFIPYSFFQPFFYLLLNHSTSAFLTASKLSALTFEQNLYISFLSPYLTTYAVIFLCLAGIVCSVRGLKGVAKTSLTLAVLVLAAGGVLSSLLLPYYEIPRIDVFLYPFVACLASVGFWSLLSRRLAWWLATCAVALGAVWLIEPTLVTSYGGIPLAITSGQTASSLLSAGFVLGLGVLAWKTLESTRLHGVLFRRHGLTGRSTQIVAISIIAGLSLYQSIVLVATQPPAAVPTTILGESQFNSLDYWLNTNIPTGSVILTNGNTTIVELSNDTLLQMIHNHDVSVLPIPKTETQLQNLTASATKEFLVIFKVAEYTLTDSYSPGQYSSAPGSWSILSDNSFVAIYSGFRS